MRIYVREFDDVYGFVYMLHPKDDAIHIKLLWMPPHMMDEFNVCHYEVSFTRSDDSARTRADWLDGLPELLINCIGLKPNQKLEIPANENVMQIKPDDDWEEDLLSDLAVKDGEEMKDKCGFDFISKLDMIARGAYNRKIGGK